jgi:hypothetical protein
MDILHNFTHILITLWENMKRRWRYNIKVDLRKIIFDETDGIQLSQERRQMAGSNREVRDEKSLGPIIF